MATQPENSGRCTYCAAAASRRWDGVPLRLRRRTRRGAKATSLTRSRTRPGGAAARWRRLRPRINWRGTSGTRECSHRRIVIHAWRRQRQLFIIPSPSVTFQRLTAYCRPAAPIETCTMRARRSGETRSLSAVPVTAPNAGPEIVARLSPTFMITGVTRLLRRVPESVCIIATANRIVSSDGG